MTVVNPPWSFNLNFAKGDIPSGYYPALYDHTGTLIPNQQFDQARTWSDGSLRRATFSMISPDTFAGNGNSGDTFNYSVHKTAGSPGGTPLVTLADVQAQDIKLVFSGFDCGSDTFQLRLNDLLAAANNVIRSASQPYASYVGTLTASSGATAGSTSITFAGLTATVTDDPCNATFTATSIDTSGVMTVSTSGQTGFVHVGATVTGTGIPAGTTITAPIGAAGGYDGTYQLSQAPASALSNVSVSATFAGSSLPFQVSVGMQAYTGSAPNGAYVTAISGNTITLSAPGLDATNSTIKFGYPVWQYDQIKYGPVCSEWKFRGLLRRVSDGAWHKWVYAVIFLKAWAKTGSWEITVRAEQSNCYGPHPTGSVGQSLPGVTNGVIGNNGSSTLSNASAMPRFVAPATLYNGATVLAYFGGLNDWTAFALNAATFPVAGGYVNSPSGNVDSTGLRSFYGTAWAFDPGSGTLPTGLVTNRPYWQTNLYFTGNYALCLEKFHAVQLNYGNTPQAWSTTGTITGSISGTTLTVTALSAGVVLAPYMSGLSGTGIPGGTLIKSNGTGTGGTGTYNLNNSATVSSETITITSTVTAGNYYQTSDGTLWMPTSTAATGGSTSDAPVPSGTYADVTTADGITWEQATTVISGGSGTITMYQVPALFANTGWLGKDQYGNAIWWQGSGSLAARPKLMLAPEFNYLTTKTTATPPFNPSVATSPNNPGATVPLPDGLTFDYDRNATGLNYYHSYQPNNAPPWNPAFDMSEVGDDPGDERVGPISFASSWLLYQPGSTHYSQLVRCLNYSVADWPIWFVNEQSGYLWAANNGPGRVNSVGGSNYAGLGTTDPTASAIQSGFWPTVNIKPPYGLPRYLCSYGPVIDSEHLPHLPFVPMLLDGDMVDWETSAGLAIAIGMSDGQNYPQLSSYGSFHKTYGGCAAGISGTPRGMAWPGRVMGNTEFMMPDGHPLFRFIQDCYDDTGSVFQQFYGDSTNLAPNQALQGQMTGMPDDALTIGGVNLYGGLSWHTYMHQFVWGWMAWRESFEGRRPTFKNFLTGYMAPAINLWNSDLVTYGSEYWVGQYYWACTDSSGNWFPGGASDAIKYNFPTIYNEAIPATNWEINDVQTKNAFGGNSGSLNTPPGAYAWDTNNYVTMGYAMFAMLTWISYPGAQNVYNRMKTRINTSPCQGITWAQTNNVSYDEGHPAAYLAWNFMSVLGS